MGDRPGPPSGAEAAAHLDRDGADLLAAAKMWLTATPTPGGPRVGDMPYLSVALYALVAVPTAQVATMATDPAWRLYVNPAWLLQRTPSEVAHELAHQVWHLLADHAGRAADVGVSAGTSRAWRVATDLTVHSRVRTLAGPSLRGSRAGPPAPTPANPAGARELALGDAHALIPPAALGWPEGLAAEQYFALISGLPADDPRESGRADDHPDAAWLPRSVEGRDGGGGTEQQGPAPATARGAPPDPSCGSGCDGIPRSYQLPERSALGGLSEVAGHAIRRSVAIAYREQRGQGSTPGEWDRWVEQVLDPVVDWRTVLHAAVRRGLGWAQGHTDYTYTRISRRQAAAGPVVLPALRRPAPRVGIVVDTSGSVDDGLLAQALGEVDGVLASLAVSDPQVSVLAVDAAVQTVATVRRADALRLAGGGGTDMSLGIEAAQQLRPRVDVIIVLTDGLTGWPGLPAPVPVVAVLIGRTRAELPATPDWIHRVECVR